VSISDIPLTQIPRAERLEVLDAIQAADLKVLRLFISETSENFKNTGSVYMPDIEPKEVGRFDDTQLKAIDQLMVEAHERGKLQCSRFPT
jgi:mannan endo-1,4-beta-mannosidase